MTGNSYVAKLLSPVFDVYHPNQIENLVFNEAYKGTKVRVAMVKGNDWKDLLPEPVVNYMQNYNLVERFRKEFGEETLKRIAQGIDREELEDELVEKNRIRLG